MKFNLFLLALILVVFGGIYSYWHAYSVGLDKWIADHKAIEEQIAQQHERSKFTPVEPRGSWKPTPAPAAPVVLPVKAPVKINPPVPKTCFHVGDGKCLNN